MPDHDTPPFSSRALLPSPTAQNRDEQPKKMSVGHHPSPSTASLTSLYTVASLSSSTSASTSSSNELVTPPSTPILGQDTFRSPRIRPLGARPRPTLLTSSPRSRRSPTPPRSRDEQPRIAPITPTSHSRKRSYDERFESLSSAIEQQLLSRGKEKATTPPRHGYPKASSPSDQPAPRDSSPPLPHISVSAPSTPPSSNPLGNHHTLRLRRLETPERKKAGLQRSDTLMSPISPQTRSLHKRQYSSTTELPPPKPEPTDVIDWDRLDKVLGTWKASRRAKSPEVEEMLQRRVRGGRENAD